MGVREVSTRAAQFGLSPAGPLVAQRPVLGLVREDGPGIRSNQDATRTINTTKMRAKNADPASAFLCRVADNFRGRALGVLTRVTAAHRELVALSN